jgi:ubiquitin carboxyl-terminal hydrolase 25
MPEWSFLATIDRECRNWRQDGERHRHDLHMISTQCPPKATEDNEYITSAMCTGCLYHFVFRFHSDPSAANCTEKSEYPMHHIIRSSFLDAKDLANDHSKYNPVVALGSFACSAPRCTLRITVQISAPRIPRDFQSMLLDPNLRNRRVAELMKTDPERFAGTNGTSVADKWRAPAIELLHLYMQDVVRNGGYSNGVRLRVQKRNKRYVIQLGEDFDQLLRALEFEEDVDEETGDSAWLVPTLELESQTVTTAIGSRKAYFEDVLAEINSLMTMTQASQGGHILPADTRLLRHLGAASYPTTMVDRLYDSADFARLGATANMKESLLEYAYSRQCWSSPDQIKELLSSLKRLADGRNNFDLDTFIALQESMVESMGQQPRTAGKDNEDLVWQAYQYFRLGPDCRESDEFIIQAYKVQCESSPKQKDTARTMLGVIGRHRNSDKILAAAKGPMDINEACRFLEVDVSWPPESIVALSTTLVSVAKSIAISWRPQTNHRIIV